MTEGMTAVPAQQDAKWWIERSTPKRSIFKRLRDGPSLPWRMDHLCVKIEVLRNRLATHLEVRQGAPAWAVIAQKALDDTEGAATSGHLDTGWRFVHEAERALVAGWSAEELESQVVTLREECAAKLAQWDRGAAQSLLSPNIWTSLATDQKMEHLQEALRLLHRSYADSWFRHRVVRRQTINLPWWMGAVVVVLVGLHVAKHVGAGPIAVFVKDADPIISVIFMGLLGGLVSAFLSLSGTTFKTRIPELLLSNTVTSVRIFFGAAAALAVYFALDTNLAQLLFNIDFKQDGAVLFISFAAGFSERIVRRGVEKVGG